MELKVVIEKPNDESSEPLIATFNENGGTIGRGAGNDLRVQDPSYSVSSKHAQILFESGHFFIEDLNSKNGTFKITEDEKESKITKILIHDGDIFKISYYILKMEIPDTLSETPGGEGEGPADTQEPGENLEEEDEDIGKPTVDLDDILKGLKNGDDDEGFSAPGAAGGEGGCPAGTQKPGENPENEKKGVNSFETLGNTLIAHGKTLQTLDTTIKTLDTTLQALDKSFQGALLNPTNLYPRKNDSKPPPPVSDDPKVPKGGERLSAGDSKIFKKLLESLGIVEEIDITQENMLKSIETVGNVLRELIDGLMKLLRARTDVKSMFGIDLTVIEKKENNPLKFLPTVEEVIKLMFLDKNSGYMNAINAVKEAHKDLRNHQIAMNTGTNKLVGELVKSFDPVKFEKKHDKGFFLQKKAKCWKDYKKNYEVSKQRVFEKEMIDVFVKEYEDVIYKYQDVVSDRESR